jgi:histidine triad (HIT) family protein
MGQHQAAPDCLFCRMVSGDVAAQEVVRTESVLAFRDINPQAPTHVLVVPIDHYADLSAVAGSGGDLLTQMGRVAAEIGARECPGGWRWVFNSGPDAGQAVFHVHGHVIGGRELRWPPG